MLNITISELKQTHTVASQLYHNIGVREAITGLELKAQGKVLSFRRPTIDHYKTSESDFIFIEPTKDGFTHLQYKNTVSKKSLIN